MWTVPRVLVRRTASPAHADFVGLRSLTVLVVVRLVVMPRPPHSLRRLLWFVGWADILLDVIGGVESALWEGSWMSEDHDRCFSILVLGAFSTSVFNTNALPRINIGANVWGESSIMTGVY